MELMNKFVLLFVAIFTALMVNAQTILLNPGEPLNYEMQVDTVEYPELKNVDVNWYLGFDKEIQLNPGGAYYSAWKVDASFITTMNDGTKMFHMEKTPNFWEKTNTVRTAYLFYVHKTTTKTIADNIEGKSYYTKDEFDGWICDTTANFHILKELELSDLTNWTFNNTYQTKITEGDTVKVNVFTKDSLDIQKYILTANNEIIATSTTSYFEFVPTNTMGDVHLTLVNNISEYEYYWGSPYDRSITIYPKFVVTDIKYTTVTQPQYTGTNDKITKTVEGNTNVEVLNHDSVTLVINTNLEETLNPTSITYNWNKEGKLLPDDVISKEGQLIISEYNKATMDGIYNCHISANNATYIVTFDITSSFPTANEIIDIKDFTIITDKNLLTIKSTNSKKIKIVDIAGKVYFNKNTDNVSINIPSGVYFVILDKEAHKVIVK